MFAIETDRWGGDRDAEHISVLQHAPLEERLTVKRIGCVVFQCCTYGPVFIAFAELAHVVTPARFCNFASAVSLFAFLEINTPCECDLFQIISPNFYAIVKCRFNRLRYFRDKCIFSSSFCFYSFLSRLSLFLLSNKTNGRERS